MKNLFYLVLVSLLLISCQQQPTDYSPESTLSTEKQDSFKYEIVRYAGRLAKRAKYENKFDTKFDEAYKTMATSMHLHKYYVNPNDGYTYFEVSRIAPSIHERYVATGGRLKKNATGEITEYEEIYRTWKMEQSDLRKKSDIFFDYMVHGKDLAPYYTANIGDTEHIEFPDQQTFFNKTTRRWEMKDPKMIL